MQVLLVDDGGLYDTIDDMKYEIEQLEQTIAKTFEKYKDAPLYAASVVGRELNRLDLLRNMVEGK